MKKSFLIKVLTLLLSFVCAFGFVGCDKNKEEIDAKLPDYSSNTDGFDAFAYVGPTNGTYPTEDGDVFVEDFRTKERYEEYLNSGMNMVLIRYENSYQGEDWTTSNAKKCFDAAYAAGCDKIVLTDLRIDYLVNSNLIIDGGETNLDTDEKLDAKVEEYMSVYKDANGLYGLCIKDEPTYANLSAYGKVYKSVKRVAKKLEISNDIYIHCNLFPMYAGIAKLTDEQGVNQLDAYKKYVHTFFEESGANRVAVDIYPFLGDDSFENYFYTTLQVLRTECDANDAKLTYVAQSYSYYNNGNRVLAPVDKAGLYLQINSAIAYGADEIAFYTYFPWQGLEYDVKTSFVDREGNKNNTYYWAKEILSEMQSVSDILLGYKFEGAKIITKSPSNYSTACYTAFFDNGYEFELVKDFVSDNDAALVAEAYDAKNELYMYTVQNITNPKLDNVYMNVTVTFDPQYNYVAVIECGGVRYEKLSDGKYSTCLSAGYAQQLIPLK